MSIVTCTRRIQFCAGHRVYQHESKCRNVHGHNYVAMITAQAPSLDALGRVIDFSVLKDRVGGWIDREWDHGFLVYVNDRELVALFSDMPEQKLFVLPYNPTAENMARFLLDKVCPSVLDGTGVDVVEVELWETENCKATVTANGTP